MRKIKEIISSGKLGKIKMVHGSFTFVMTKQDDIRWDPAMGGGGLWDIGCYPLSFTRTRARNRTPGGLWLAGHQPERYR